MSSDRIKQAVGIVVCEDRKFRIRISRQSFGNLVRYWQKYPSFKYMKIYEIVDYKRGTTHSLGNKIAYITRNGSDLNPNGLGESNASQDWKRRNSI